MGIILIMVVVYIVVNIIIANFMADAAYAKGYDSSAHAFGMTFCLGIFGCLYVIALPDLKLQKQNEQIIELLSNKPTQSETFTQKEEELPEL